MPAVWNILCHNARRYKIVSDGFSHELQRLTEWRSWSHTADIGTLWCLSCALAVYVVLAKPRWSCKSHRLCRCACSSPCGRPRSVRPERSRSMWLFHRERRWKPPCGSSRGAPDPREHSLICEYDTLWYIVVFSTLATTLQQHLFFSVWATFQLTKPGSVSYPVMGQQISWFSVPEAKNMTK